MLREIMNILHVVQRYYPAWGGSELFMRQLSERLAQDGKNNVTVLTTDILKAQDFWSKNVSSDLKSKETFNDVDIIRCETNPFFFLSSEILTKVIRKGLEYLGLNIFWKNKLEVPTSSQMLGFINDSKRKKFDVVHVTAMPYGHLFYIGLKIAQKDKAKFFMSPFIHLGLSKKDPIRKNYFKKHYIKFYEEADKVFVQTDAESKSILDFLATNSKTKVEKDKLVKVGLGLDTEELKEYDPSIFRKKHGLNYPIVFYIGGQNEAKGTETLVKAMELLWEKGVKAHLVLAGEMLPDFKRFLDKSKFKNKILELGRVSEEEKYKLFSSGDVFSMVSRSDSFGIVYLESWYYKIPVIACDTPVFREIVSDGKDGYVNKFGDEQSLALKIEALINDADKRKKMGESGYQKVMKNYLLDQKLDIIMSQYK
jgi:glycosyltransferase involved in cell wall biosynthesis